MLIRRACGISEADMRNPSAQPGRIGSGTRVRASSKAASTAFVPAGRRMAAQRSFTLVGDRTLDNSHRT
ncbi:hypothetical protein GCM10017771_92770 [Streptomyces capitiformicae]|uniref:Uncharacterized protein n=1 Tax=Streptomyces capitiformicae TaxID=2014920 RepID=A0A918ZTA6_9ACTN|nr:hypothetical protein GCM10017771_92770 [Streptomyces capitiformicae]